MRKQFQFTICCLFVVSELHQWLCLVLSCLVFMLCFLFLSPLLHLFSLNSNITSPKNTGVKARKYLLASIAVQEQIILPVRLTTGLGIDTFIAVPFIFSGGHELHQCLSLLSFLRALLSPCPQSPPLHLSSQLQHCWNIKKKVQRLYTFSYLLSLPPSRLSASTSK